MDKALRIQELLLRFRRLPFFVVALSLAVLAGAILLTTLQLRARIREQIAGRDGEVLHAVALMEYADDVEQGLAGPITDPGNQLSVVLRSAQLKGVLGVRLFDPGGHFVEAFPPDVRDGAIEVRDLPLLQSLKPACHFHRAVRLSEIFFPTTAAPASPDPELPVLEVNVPLHTETDARLAGIAQFLIEGHSIAAEYARLDRHLAGQALAAFVVGGGILALALVWAFRRLRRAHLLLAERTQNLVRANQELALAAKTTALGAVTAHLLHGLKNPLAGLQSFVATHPAPDEAEAADWQQAVASTRRMQALINQALAVLHEEATGTRYEVSLGELIESIQTTVQPVVRETGVTLRPRLETQAIFPNHVANLAALILVNLVQNALQATPRGGTVEVVAARSEGHVVLEVRDQGPGFPETLRPFVPCRSTKDGGSGIGLALSKQLANHLGAALDLKRNTPQGCVFALALPASLCIVKSNDAPLAAVG